MASRQDPYSTTLKAYQPCFAADPSASKKHLKDLAEKAETAERFEDMCKFMNALVVSFCNERSGLNIPERNLLSVAYKNVIGTRRSSWRSLNSDDNRDSEIIREYKRQVEAEMESICREVLELLENVLITQQESDPEAQVFYLKMAGDYYRYLAEFKDKVDGSAEKSRKFYEDALQLAKRELPNGEPTLAPTHPIRLGLALNYSVCYYEILNEKSKACELAKNAFDSAIKQLDDLDEHSYKDSTLIMQLLRDNLTLWQTNSEDLRVDDMEYTNMDGKDDSGL